MPVSYRCWSFHYFSKVQGLIECSSAGHSFRFCAPNLKKAYSIFTNKYDNIKQGLLSDQASICFFFHTDTLYKKYMTSQEIRNKAQKRPVCLKLPPPWPSELVGRLAFSGSGHHHYGTTLLPAV